MTNDYKTKGELLILKEKIKKLEKENYELRKNISDRYKLILEKEKVLNEKVKLLELENKLEKLESKKKIKYSKDFNSENDSCILSEIEVSDCNKIIDFEISKLFLLHNLNYNKFINYFSKEDLVENFKMIKNNIIEYLNLFLDREDVLKDILYISLSKDINILEFIKILNIIYREKHTNKNKPFNITDYSLNDKIYKTQSQGNTPFCLELKEIVLSSKLLDFLNDNYKNEDVIVFIINYTEIIACSLNSKIIKYIINMNNIYSKFLVMKLKTINYLNYNLEYTTEF